MKFPKEIQGRNLISTIEDCLKEHAVTIKQGEDAQTFYLIEQTVRTPLFDDFICTYAGEVDKFKTELAKQLMLKRSTEQTYGVLVNTDLRDTYAFNRAFADLDREKQAIVFKDMEEVLLERAGKKDITSYKAPEKKKPLPEGGYHDNFFEGNNSFEGPLIKYSLTGKKGDSEKPKPAKDIVFEKPSLLANVKNHYNPDKVVLIMEDGKQELYMIYTEYKTSSRKDFLEVYGKELNKFQKSLALKLFPDKKTDNSYCMVMDDNLQIQFVFNTEFAYYQTNKINFYTPEEVILKRTGPLDLSEAAEPESGETRSHGSRDRVMKYALIGKK